MVSICSSRGLVPAVVSPRPSMWALQAEQVLSTTHNASRNPICSSTYSLSLAQCLLPRLPASYPPTGPGRGGGGNSALWSFSTWNPTELHPRAGLGLLDVCSSVRIGRLRSAGGANSRFFRVVTLHNHVLVHDRPSLGVTLEVLVTVEIQASYCQCDEQPVQHVGKLHFFRRPLGQCGRSIAGTWPHYPRDRGEEHCRESDEEADVQPAFGADVGEGPLRERNGTWVW